MNDGGLRVLFAPYMWAAAAAYREFGDRVRLRTENDGERLSLSIHRQARATMNE
jgi:hypothetical protein